MTETDRVYVAITETMKKYGVEQVIAALKNYITEGNANYFTSTNNARRMIMELSPSQVLQDALITNLKYEQIIRERGYAQELPNYMVVQQAIAQYQSGQPISIELSSRNLEELMSQMIRHDVSQAVQLLANNPEVFESFLGSYCVSVCNFRPDLNNIPKENYPAINEYFAQFEQQDEKQRV